MPPDGLLRAWLATRWAMAQPVEALTRSRARQWRRLQPALACTPALAALAGRALADFPVTDIATIRADYAAWTSTGHSHAALHAAAADTERGGSGEVAPGLVAGFSTGSSGTRGLFLASAAERADYLGQSLARLLPARALLRPQRIALLLRATSRLYSDVGSARVGFRHIPLERADAAALADLTDFAPTIMIAQPHRLLALATHAERTGKPLPRPRWLFYGAEPLSATDGAWLKAQYGTAPRPIYQATEGFIAGACRYGRLHLNEHSLTVELEPVPGTPGFRPILTDLRRTSQPIVRVRGDDYLETDPRPCPCGYAGRVIQPVMGRVTDIWRFADRAVTPGAVIASVEAALGAPAQWQAEASPGGVRLIIAPDIDTDLADRAAAALARDCALPVPVALIRAAPEAPSPKRRRVRWQGLAHA